MLPSFSFGTQSFVPSTPKTQEGFQGFHLPQETEVHFSATGACLHPALVLQSPESTTFHPYAAPTWLCPDPPFLLHPHSQAPYTVCIADVLIRMCVQLLLLGVHLGDHL